MLFDVLAIIDLYAQVSVAVFLRMYTSALNDLHFGSRIFTFECMLTNVLPIL